MNDLSHLEDYTEEQTEDSLETIVKYAEEYDRLKEELEIAEANLKDAKKKFDKLSMETLPDALINAGVSEIKLADGRTVAYKESLKASCKDIDLLVPWLEQQGEDGIVRVTLELGKTPQNVLNKIITEISDKYGLLPDVKTGVHHSTLTATLSRLCGVTKGHDAEVNLAELDPAMVSAYTFYKTTVK